VNAASERVESKAVKSDMMTGCGTLVGAKLPQICSEICSVSEETFSQPSAVCRHWVNGPVSTVAIPGRLIDRAKTPTAARAKEIAMIQRMVVRLERFSNSPPGELDETQAAGQNFFAAGGASENDCAAATSGKWSRLRFSTGDAEVQRPMLPWASAC